MRVVLALVALLVSSCARGEASTEEPQAKAGGQGGGGQGGSAGGQGGGGGANSGGGMSGSAGGVSAGGGSGMSGSAGGVSAGGGGGMSGGAGGGGGASGTSGGAAGAGGKAQVFPTVCGEAVENGDVSLECPEGSVIGAVVFAGYGTPTGACGSYHAGKCDAATAASVVFSLCGGRTKCKFKAANSVFGEPCSGTVKEVRAEVQCVACGFSGTQACGPTCTNLQTDPANCGACGAPCDVGDTCQSGSCVCLPPDCNQSCFMGGFDYGNCTVNGCSCGNN